MSASPSKKRQFLIAAFHPVGGEVCSALGLMSVSKDVSDMEIASAVDLRRRVTGADWFTDLVRMAGWYSEGMKAIVDHDLPLNRENEEHLLSYFVATSACIDATPSPEEEVR